jgi:hypothetical protein
LAAKQQGFPTEIKKELIKLGMGHLRSVMTQNQPDLPISEIVKCPICLCELETCRMGYKNVIFTPSGHPFHPSCMRNLTKNECPVCRRSLSDAEMDNLQEGAQNAVEAAEERDNLAFDQNGDAAPPF